MRSLFSGNRPAAPLGPPSKRGDSGQDSIKPETLQAVRQRQRDRQRRHVMHMMRAEKERDEADDAGDSEKFAAAEAQRRQMSDAADALAQQIMIIERIMEEFGLTLDLEEEARADHELLEQSRDAYDHRVAEVSEAVADINVTGEYVNSINSPYMMPSEVYDEDEAMRDLDECAKQTSRM